MPWQLPGELAGRVQRARRLLAESEAHAGSADLQRFLESAHLTEQLHQKWLTEDGTMRQGLSVRDKQQGLVLYLLWSLSRLQRLPYSFRLTATCQLALHAAMKELTDEPSSPSSSASSSSTGSVGSKHAAWLLGMWAGEAAYASACAWEARQDDAECLLQEGALANWDGHVASLLQHYQQQQGFEPAISAGQLHQLFLLLRCEVRLGMSELDAAASAERQALLASGDAADYAQLCELQPENPAYLTEHAQALFVAGRQAEAFNVCLAARRAATTANSPVNFVRAAVLLVLLMLRARQVPAARLARVSTVQASAEQHLALLRDWAPQNFVLALQANLDHSSALLRLVAGTAAAQPQPVAAPAPSAAALPRPAPGTQLPISRRLHPHPEPASPAVVPAPLQQQPVAPSQPIHGTLGPRPAAATEQPQPQQAAAERCSLCGKAVAAHTPARCARCHTTVYCGRRCQGRHWLGGHREECTRIATQRFNARLAAEAAARSGGAGGMPSAAAAAAAAVDDTSR